ncbi:peptide-methionine (S)-S-oxide reductase MsrA [Novosphingobium album (ex Liu et al. 2023)]|uniref:Peptide methionine sulfoxide reductase MsrA n=1 Tax=Novosphingobium album (ex Liu et al. 2023) TaxID=3031130 RepID=A0ABT5WV60_9SPHN|nr:peptide-methionine (S)-S-oxide reductase MsrA [Novosphingobium album (ex Liu et al. 2023)]MDE8653764.1 peptide-methionine (S)-S-oxide reductase MsrA [Novosphingobium album (ex Liu et al. 2023)]
MKRGGAILPLLALAAACQQPASAETVVRAPAAALTAAEGKGIRTAIFAGGCFWGVEGVFSHVKGVTSVVSGYHGGAGKDADYASVSSGATGHAEAVRVRYDPAVVRYDELLRIFFSVAADPTTLNRQGPDIGTQYRSALVPLDAGQRQVATAYLAQLAKARLWSRPIVTRIESYRGFFPAERHHQDFMAANPRNPYILRWDQPKVAGLKALYPGYYQAAFTKG